MRAAATRARLIKLVADEQRRFMAKPSVKEVVELKEFNPARTTDKLLSSDRFGKFVRGNAYEGWERSLFSIEWFDTTPERTVGNMVDADSTVSCWVRLHVGELPILWNASGQHYNPDLIVIDSDDTHWVVEVKMDKDMTSEDVLGKRRAAKTWVNHVNADDRVTSTWRYLLVSENDIKTARGSWAALKKLGV